MAHPVTRKARKDQGKCSKCGHKIVPGEKYVRVDRRFSTPVIRCDKPECRPRQSEIVTSDKLSRVYAVVEAFDDFKLKDGKEALIELIDNSISELEEVSSEYQESADNKEEHFPGTGDEIREKADMLFDWISALEDLKNELEDEETTEERFEEIASECSEGNPL